MGKLYYGDAVTRIRNAGFKPEPVRSNGKLTGVMIDVYGHDLVVMADEVGLYDVDSIFQLIANANGWKNEEQKHRYDPRYGG